MMVKLVGKGEVKRNSFNSQDLKTFVEGLSNNNMPFYGPFSRYTWASRCSHKEETYWNNHWIFINRMSYLPLNLQSQSTTGKPSGLVFLFYRHGISTPCLTNSVKALNADDSVPLRNSTAFSIKNSALQWEIHRAVKNHWVF